jgi:calmodulin
MIDATTNDGVITSIDLEVIFNRLSYAHEDGEIEDILWEVDDDGDGGLTWPEFQRVYERVRSIGEEVVHGAAEPTRMYSLIEFLMFDLGANGSVSVDEATEIFYRRYGR